MIGEITQTLYNTEKCKRTDKFNLKNCQNALSIPLL